MAAILMAGTITCTSPYGPRGSDFHYGIDLVTADPGRMVYAPFDGVVTFYGWEDPNDHTKGYGFHVIIRLTSDANKYIVFGHLVEDGVYPRPVVDTSVSAGTLIGIMGNTGSSTGAHLHLEGRLGSNYGSQRWTMELAALLPTADGQTLAEHNVAGDVFQFVGSGPLPPSGGDLLMYSLEKNGDMLIMYTNKGKVLWFDQGPNYVPDRQIGYNNGA